MKLIIDISEESYNNLKTGCTQRVSDDEMIEALKNGTPLDDVKAEVEKMPTEKIVRCRKAYIFASEFKIKVLEILDNIGKAESEDKE